MKKIRTNKINKKTYFELAHPTYADAQEREAESRSFRNALQMYRLDLEIIEQEIEAEKTIIRHLIAERLDDWKQDVQTSRTRIAKLQAKYLEAESEASTYVEDFRLEWAIRHLKGWNYADGTGGLAASQNEALPLPVDVEEFKALALDQRIVTAITEEVRNFYDGEEEKND